jgi:hypothetical protein
MEREKATKMRMSRFAAFSLPLSNALVNQGLPTVSNER